MASFTATSRLASIGLCCFIPSSHVLPIFLLPLPPLVSVLVFFHPPQSDNILVAETSNTFHPCLIDFGMACIATSSPARRLDTPNTSTQYEDTLYWLNESGTADWGNPSTRPPDLAGGKPGWVDYRGADLYALALTFYRVLLTAYLGPPPMGSDNLRPRAERLRPSYGFFDAPLVSLIIYMHSPVRRCANG